MLESYNAIRNLDEHVEHLDMVLDYHQAKGVVKWKLFFLALNGMVMSGFKDFKDV